MFNKLRNRLILMNMAFISVIMLSAFAVIYTITYQDIKNDIRMELHRVGESYRKPFGGPDGQSPSGVGGGMTPTEGMREGMGPPPHERSVSFALTTDLQWNITGASSRYDMSDEFFEQAGQKAASASSEFGQFSLDGASWAYSVQSGRDGYSIVYLDVSARQDILMNLVYTFSVVALAMLAVIYMTSRYFAGRSIAPIKEAFMKQKQFIADASHELRTPLAVINTNADVLLANSDDTIAQQSKWLQHIKSETERMKTLTDDLLYLTEMDDARSALLHTPFNLSEAVEGITLAMEAVIYEKQIAFDSHIQPGLTAVGNKEQLSQVVMILLDNASKYTPPGGAITVRLEQQGTHQAALKVTNSGEGIAAEHLDKIFDRFYRTDSSRSRKHGGYGLGLAIAKSIVEQHRGKIVARSIPNETTTFTVQLPTKHA